MDQTPEDRLSDHLRAQRWRNPKVIAGLATLALALAGFAVLLLGPQPEIRFRTGEIVSQRFAPSSKTPMQMAFEVRLDTGIVVVTTRDPLAASEPGQPACLRETRGRFFGLTRRALVHAGFCR